jgi:hypothetical protein
MSNSPDPIRGPRTTFRNPARNTAMPEAATSSSVSVVLGSRPRMSEMAELKGIRATRTRELGARARITFTGGASYSGVSSCQFLASPA